MFLYAEQILLDLTTCQNDCYHRKQALLLTSQLVDLINLSEYHQSNSEVLLDRLSSPNATEKLVNLLKNADDTEVLDNVINIFNFIFEFRKGASIKIDLSETELWKVLFNLVVNPHEFIPKETYHSMLETLANYFKNKNHVAAACESLENSKILARYLSELLFYKTEKLKNEKSKKTAQKRRKAAVSILSSVSRHKEGPELIRDAGLIERLHSYVLQISTDEKSDVIVHKIGQTILRCIPLRNLPGLTDTRSAYVYRSFGRSPGALEGSDSYDSSEESEEEDDESEQSSCDENNELASSPASFRSPEELEQYRIIIEDDRGADSKDELKELFESASLGWSRTQVYESLAQNAKSIHGFTLIPCPDWANANGNYENEKLYVKDRRVCRDKLLKTLSLALYPDAYKPELVYDLDACLLSPETNRTLKMIDVESVSRGCASVGKSLLFESRFESGNLRKAFKVGDREYDLILNADVNSAGRQQWFYFRVAGGIRSSVSYTFNILNFEKQRNLFNQGMKPVVFSVKEYSKTGQAIWKRIGSEICYYRNIFRRAAANQSYWTLSFDVTFPFDNDVVYIAYHYPYTYTQLMSDIVFWQREYQNFSRSQLKVSSLCHSPCGNPIPVMWIRRSQELHKAPVSFVSARVHPGESCASWCLRGFVNAAFNDKQSTHSHRLRNSPSLCVVPMLNVDGTVHGCARTEVTNEDLNRKWLKPEKRHPSIYHAKGLIEFIRRTTGARPLVLCDMHGHSRRFNAFLYGCQSTDSNQIGTRLMSSEILRQPSKDEEEDTAHILPVFVQTLKSKIPEYLDILQCSWKMEESRESTARIVGWRHLGFANSYTLECSMAGFQLQPEDEWIHFNTAKYKEIGSAVYKTIQQMSELS